MNTGKYMILLVHLEGRGVIRVVLHVFKGPTCEIENMYIASQRL